MFEGCFGGLEEGSGVILGAQRFFRTFLDVRGLRRFLSSLTGFVEVVREEHQLEKLEPVRKRLNDL